MNTPQTHPGNVANSWETPRRAAELAGRILLGTLFLLSGLAKIGAYSATVGYMASMGVPGALLPLVILTELCLMLIIGLKTRIVAFLLGGYCGLNSDILPSQFRRSESIDAFPQGPRALWSLFDVVGQWSGTAERRSPYGSLEEPSP